MGNCRVVSIINWKGGVGKTTMTHHLGTGFFHLGQDAWMKYFGSENPPRILLIDSDPQCSLSIACLSAERYEELIYDKKMPTLLNLYQALLDNQPEADYSSSILKWHVRRSLNKAYPTVDLLPSNQELIFMDFNIAMYGQGGGLSTHKSDLYKFQIMDKILAPLRQRYEFIFIDCPPSFNFVTLNALYASDYYLIPTRLDELSTYGLEAIIKRVNDMNDLFRGQVADYRPVSLAGIVPNSVRLYRQGPVASQVNILERLCTGMGTDVFPVYVTEGEGIPTAVQGGFPVYGLTNSSKARDQAGEMLEVLRELLDRVTGGAS